MSMLYLLQPLSRLHRQSEMNALWQSDFNNQPVRASEDQIRAIINYLKSV
jgi:hypothetical protein